MQASQPRHLVDSGAPNGTETSYTTIFHFLSCAPGQKQKKGLTMGSASLIDCRPCRILIQAVHLGAVGGGAYVTFNSKVNGKHM